MRIKKLREESRFRRTRSHTFKGKSLWDTYENGFWHFFLLPLHAFLIGLGGFGFGRFWVWGVLGLGGFGFRDFIGCDNGCRYVVVAF